MESEVDPFRRETWVPFIWQSYFIFSMDLIMNNNRLHKYNLHFIYYLLKNSMTQHNFFIHCNLFVSRKLFVCIIQQIILFIIISFLWVNDKLRLFELGLTNNIFYIFVLHWGQPNYWWNVINKILTHLTHQAPSLTWRSSQ